jgi:uncharacterized protein (DUF1800 family)
MKVYSKIFLSIILIFCGLILFSSFQNNDKSFEYFFPYKKAGLTDRQAAAHLLSRFTYGAKPGDVDRVLAIGLEKWFQLQLEGNLTDDYLDKRLAKYDGLNLTNTEATNGYPPNNIVLRLAIKEGVINKDSIGKTGKNYNDLLNSYKNSKGFKPEQELTRQFISQKILRASYSNNQLEEILTDFWFNHFNVSMTKNQCARYIPSYERDVIRPNVTGHFSTLLLATAKSPAMLFYLDNYANTGKQTKASKTLNNISKVNRSQVQQKSQLNKVAEQHLKQKIVTKGKTKSGINENYAREVMELHTMGVDGGYTQADVTNAAGILSGWTMFPADTMSYNAGIKKLVNNKTDQFLRSNGFVHDGDFLYVPGRHDDSTRIVLNATYKGDSGYDDGVDLLNMLAHQPSTEKFISKKLAIRFVSDNPSNALVHRMSAAFHKSDGDVKQVLIAMVTSVDFWNSASVRQKTKSPFELAISAIRALDANVEQPYQVFIWINKMGQKIYYYQAPNGYPDRSEYWINSGSLLNRMNFGLAISSGRIPGLKLNLAKLNNYHEPESQEAALIAYGKIILPEKDLKATISRLAPMLSDPEISKKVQNAADRSAKVPALSEDKSLDVNTMEGKFNGNNADQSDENIQPGNRHTNQSDRQHLAANKNMLSQVVGVLIGAPEFQRR